MTGRNSDLVQMKTDSRATASSSRGRLPFPMETQYG
jgi:hypothetical protein